jgi:regulator of cell morphogenesis and NO signaling
MFLSPFRISKDAFVKDIVDGDYRTAEVFRRYGIEYCCGGRWPLDTACLAKGLSPELLVAELNKAVRPIQVSPFTPFHEWNIDFLIDYIINIHHYYLRKTLPQLGLAIERFVEEHIKKDPRLGQLQRLYHQLQTDMIPHLQKEEEDVFPYVRQLAHAYEDKDPYAELLVKTLRKPIAKMIGDEQQMIIDTLRKFRELTDQYTPPEKSCTSHRVVFASLRELDNELAQHIYLENQVLFPRTLAMEKELLQS